MAKEKSYTSTVKSPRKLRGYPFHPVTGIKRTKRGGVTWAKTRSVRPKIHSRTAALVGTGFNKLASEEARASQDVAGSLEERLFDRALQNWGFARGIDYDFQSSMYGGRAEFGGLLVDFLFFPNIIVQVQSYWHTVSLEIETRDDDQAMVLQAMGYVVLEIWPVTIHDPVALDWWIQRNISHLSGTSSQPLGSSAASSDAYVSMLFSDLENVTYFGPWLEKILAIEEALE